MLKLARTDAPTAEEYATVHVAFELSKAKWKVGVMLPGSAKMSRHTIAGGDLAELTARFAAAREGCTDRQAGADRVVLRGGL